jgi:hypothetical protein
VPVASDTTASNGAKGGGKMAQPAHAIARPAACVHLFTGVATEAGRLVIAFRANKPSTICCGDYWGIPTVQPGGSEAGGWLLSLRPV